ncbi:MAG: hypothetical protein VKO01_08980 [Cyanobacteriota bacterium]|jgi:hypothetical protein|nr:hypothetical protein [Cyanobacteriota bacterium]
MKIATWNLQRTLSQSPQAALQQPWLQRIDADIWVLTEADLAIAPGPDYHLLASEAQPQTPGETWRWVQIWGRHWPFSPVPTRDPTTTTCALVDLGQGRSCLIYGTVLPLPDNPCPDPGHEQAFVTALGQQQQDWLDLQTTYPESLLIVAGDFNQDLNVLPYYGSRRNKQALRHALAAANLDCLTFGDNDPVRRLIDGQHSNIDHICMAQSQTVQLQGTFAWPSSLEELRGLSEHFGVGLEFTWS